ncbi:MAG: hypothetical protein IJT77_07560, partial [Clostridia bacterium]|nr:hypothetical protein [Clostridia bacterium]
LRPAGPGMQQNQGFAAGQPCIYPGRPDYPGFQRRSCRQINVFDWMLILAPKYKRKFEEKQDEWTKKQLTIFLKFAILVCSFCTGRALFFCPAASHAQRRRA